MATSKRFVIKNGLDNNSNTIINVSDPTNDSDAATKNFTKNASNLSTGTIPSSILGNSSLYLGTTQIVLNAASGSISSLAVNISGSSASCTGNANTATTLATARNINGVSFNGSSDIVVPTTYDSTWYRITNPGGGAYITQVYGLNTGAIAITLPVGMIYTMIRMTIKIYEYSTNKSFEVHCGGSLYTIGNTWINNPFAYIIGNPGIDRNFTVRMGYTSTDKAVVYIGELASTWSYPQIFVTEVQCGYANQSVTYTTGWSIGFEASAFQNVTATITNPQVGYATTTNTANAVVLRDASGNFAAGTITAPSFLGSTTASGTLTLQSSSDATKGKILFGTSAYDEVNNRLGIANASPSYPLDVSGDAVISGNVLIGTTTPPTTTITPGALVVNGLVKYPYPILVSGALSTNTSNNYTGILSSPSLTADGSSSVHNYGILSSPVLSATGTGGSNFVSFNGTVSLPVISDSSSNAKLYYYGNYVIVNRNSSTDYSTSTSNFVCGVQSTANHGITLESNAVTGELIGVYGSSSINSGIVTNQSVFRGYNVVGSHASGKNSSVTNSYLFNGGTFTVGKASGTTGSVTNGYGLYLVGPTVGATGTLTNYYGIFLGTSSGTIGTYYGIYQQDSVPLNYFAGKVGIGNSSPSYPLDVTGNARITGNIGLYGTIPSSTTVINCDTVYTDPVTNTCFLYNRQTPIYTGTETVAENLATLNITMRPIVNTGHNNSGIINPVITNVVRNYYGAASDDNGTLNIIYCHQLTYGHNVTNSAATPTTSNVYGLYLTPLYMTGTITNMYDIFLSNPGTGGTVTNKWGIYQQSTCNNYFGGNVLIGTVVNHGTVSIKGGSASTADSDEVTIGGGVIKAGGSIYSNGTLVSSNNYSRSNKTQANSPVTLTTANCNGFVIYTNTGSTSAVVFNLPAGSDGLRVEAIVTAAYDIQFVVNGTETIRYLETVSKAGGSIKSNIIGHHLQLNWSGTQWIASIVGEYWMLETS